MNKESLIEFFEDRPALAKSAICKEAGLQPNFLTRMFSGELVLTDEKVKKLLPVFLKYGYKTSD